MSPQKKDAFPEHRGITAADLRRTILFAALVYLAMTFINAIAGVVLLFSLIALFSLVLNPVVARLTRYGVPRQLSAALLAVLVLSAIGLFGWLVVPPAAEQLADLTADLPEQVERTQARAESWADRVGVALPDLEAEQLLEIAAGAGPLLARIGSYTLGLFSVVAGALILLISVVYVLAKPRPLVEMLLRLFRPSRRDRATRVVQNLANQTRQWALAALASMGAVFIMTWLALSIIGLPYAFLFAIVAGLLEIVPVLGPVVAAIPPILLGLSQDTMTGIWVLAAFVVIQQIESNVVFPLVMAGGLELHPVTVMFFVLAMGGLFGIIGIFLAVPAAITARVILLEFYIDNDEDKAGFEEQVEKIVSGPESAKGGKD
jgi:putative permease